MPHNLPTETCPSCHDGVVIRVEPGPEVLTKHFSCGHAQRDYSRNLKEGPFPFSDHISTEQRLGPHSTEATTYERSHGADAVVVSMQQEMYKDALHFFREARSNHAKVGADPFVTWRNLRAAILFAFAAIESCINQFIDEHVEKNKTTMSHKEIKHWTEEKVPVSIKAKLTEGVKLYGGTSLEKDPALWLDFEELRNLRNDLVHYKVANRLFYNTDELLNRTEKCIGTASVIIKKVYLAHPSNTAYPKGFDELP